MKLDQLRSFEAVARVGHFTRAAEELYLAQPSLSRQIAALEADLGTELFHRGPTGAALTDAGELLLPFARRMLGDAQTAREQMQELAGLHRGRVRLGAPPTLFTSLVADVLAEFRAAHPGIALHVMEGGSRSLMDALVEGALDLALVVTRGEGIAASGVELTPLLSEELVVVFSADSPGADEITLKELAQIPHVAFNRSYDLRVVTDAAFSANGLNPVIAVEGAEMDAVLRFVERGLGVAVVPAMVVIDRPGLRSARLVEPSLTRTVNLARRNDIGPSAAAGAMQQFVFLSVDRLSAPGTDLTQLITAVAR